MRSNRIGYNDRMKTKAQAACLVIAILLTVQPVHAWNGHGHRVIASIAFNRLEPSRRLEIANRIRKHPRWEQDFAAKMPEVVKNGDEQIQAEWIFQQASVWPDMTRRLKGEDRKKYHHPTWHYINMIAYLNDEDKEAIGLIKLNLESKPPKEQTENMNAIQAINFARLRIDGTIKVSPEEEALMWCWFFHCYADLHQPLHTTAMFSKTLLPKGCRGGNSIKTKQSRNLHALWDGLLGSDNSFQACKNQARDQWFRIGTTPFSSWITNASSVCRINHELCNEVVYSDPLRRHLQRLDNAGATEVVEFDVDVDQYLQTSGKMARLLANEAGCRMARILNDNRSFRRLGWECPYCNSKVDGDKIRCPRCDQ